MRDAVNWLGPNLVPFGAVPYFNLTSTISLPKHPLPNPIPLIHVSKHSLLPPGLPGLHAPKSRSLPRVLHFATGVYTPATLRIIATGDVQGVDLIVGKEAPDVLVVALVVTVAFPTINVFI